MCRMNELRWLGSANQNDKVWNTFTKLETNLHFTNIFKFCKTKLHKQNTFTKDKTNLHFRKQDWQDAKHFYEPWDKFYKWRNSFTSPERNWKNTESHRMGMYQKWWLSSRSIGLFRKKDLQSVFWWPNAVLPLSWKPLEPVNTVLFIVCTVCGMFKGHGPDGRTKQTKLKLVLHFYWLHVWQWHEKASTMLHLTLLYPAVQMSPVHSVLLSGSCPLNIFFLPKLVVEALWLFPSTNYNKLNKQEQLKCEQPIKNWKSQGILAQWKSEISTHWWAFL